MIGQVYLGRYQALEVIGEGAMGLVFRGWDPRLKRPVALKTLRLEMLFDEHDLVSKMEQLLQEASTAARFSHPNIVAVYDADAGPEIAYIAMEYVDGSTLDRYLAQAGRLPSTQVIPLALGIAQGLAAAHEHRIVHHDVKPGNVLLGRDASIKVSDFGVAHLVQSLVQPDKKIFGTVGYLPPETLLGEGFDERGDLFALGAILYECLTGERAFSGPTLHLRMYQTVKKQIESLRQRVPDTPPALDDLVLRLLEKNPDQRISNAREAVARLQELASRELRWAPDLGQGPLEERRSPGLHSSLFSRDNVTAVMLKPDLAE